MITLDQLHLATGATLEDAATYLDAINSALTYGEIDMPSKLAAFLATLSVESARLSTVEEGLYYRSAERLAQIFPRVFADADAAEPYVKNPEGLSKVLYDGYHGRGLIQLTWKRNYKACSDALGVDFVANPELLLQPHAAALSAAWFWKTNGCNIPANRGDMIAVTRIVNGRAMMHLKERQDQYARAISVLSFA
jgi:putative chitinase